MVSIAVANKPNNIGNKDFRTQYVVYKINCRDYEVTSFGETKQNLYKRIAQHENCSRNNNFNSSAFSKHLLENQHQFDF